MAVRTASGHPLIPDIAGITALVRSDLEGDTAFKPLIDALIRQFAIDGRSAPTIEGMLSQIRTLRAIAGNEAVRGLTLPQLDALDVRICEIIHKAVDATLPSDDTPYHCLARWLDAVTRSSSAEVFTTNYDLLIEQALEAVRAPYFDGFPGARKPFFDIRAMEEDSLPSRWTRLWKLHGSINWYQLSGEGVYRSSTEESGVRRVIHPSHLKYEESRRMPYLAMIDRLRSFLRHPTSVLVICGYSFRDEHINEVLLQGLESTPTAVAFALLYDSIGQYSEGTALGTSRPNLNMLGKDGGVIGGSLATWARKTGSHDPGISHDYLSWISGTGGEETGELHLGDFAKFGRFVNELAGLPTLAR